MLDTYICYSVWDIIGVHIIDHTSQIMIIMVQLCLALISRIMFQYEDDLSIKKWKSETTVHIVVATLSLSFYMVVNFILSLL